MTAAAPFQPGKLVSLRGREWVVLPSDDAELLIVKPLGGSDEEVTGIYLPLAIESDRPTDASFAPPSAEDLGDISTARLLYDSARLAFRNGAGPFRALAKLSFRPRAYQMVPLIMALRQDVVRLLIADDVGVGKTIEALLILRELLERGRIKRFAVVCLPHLCEQWQEEIRTKLDIEAAILRSSTQARLDRQIQGDASVYDYYPYQIVSVDFIKSDARRNVFVEQCPELVIVDEAHTCARPAGASAAQQQRHHLVSRIAAKPGQHLALLTATPHSGKPEEFQSLLGLLRPEFEAVDPPTSTPAERRLLARHFIQRKRADVEKWMNEDTPFPKREPIEWCYDLSPAYALFFDDLLEFARKLVAPGQADPRKMRGRYWTALALLRGVMSSPGAGVKMLATRREHLAGGPDGGDQSAGGEGVGGADAIDQEVNPVGDGDFGFLADNEPTQEVERGAWTDHQRRQLRQFADRLEKLGDLESDPKLHAASVVLDEWLRLGFKPVVFCRYIETARYVGRHLEPLLRRKFPALDLRVVTSEDPDDLRRQRIAEMAGDKPRVLVATDCLSEGVNLQDLFTAVLHYDLPWNPNRLEQREGRVDRFGQRAPEVKACLLYGADNPIDGIVLDVLLRKVREIKKATGISVPFPEDSQSVIDTITQALLLNPDRRIQRKRARRQRTLFGMGQFDEADRAKAEISRKIDEAAEREKASHSVFAQHAIKAQEIEEDLRAVDEAIGDPAAVEEFVVVEQLCQLVMANTLARQDKRAARSAVLRTRQVSVKTTLLLLRCRNVIEESRGPSRIVAEEMLLWGWRGAPQRREFIGSDVARPLLASARASGDLSAQARAGFLENELRLLSAMQPEMDALAERRSQQLVAAHERFSALMDKRRFQVVYPVLPMDLLGVYILLPEVPS